MTKVDAYEALYSFGITGSFGRPYFFGERIYGDFHYGEEERQIDKNEYGVKLYGGSLYGTDDVRIGIYQKRHKLGKTGYTRTKFYIPSNPKTAPQQSWRAVFTAGMGEWANLTTEQKNQYNRRADKVHLHGVNLFMREWLKSN